MLDIQFVKENQVAVAKAIKDKQVQVDLDQVLKLDQQRRQTIAKLESLRQKRNQLAQEQSTKQTDEARQIKEGISQLESELTDIETEFRAELYKVPNLPSDDTPVGSSEAENKIIYEYGQKPNFDFKPIPHWQMTNFIDKERAVRLAGKRFAFLKGDFVFLQMALVQYGFDVLTNQIILQEIIDRKKLNVSAQTFLPILPPTMMRTKPYLATNRLQPQEVTFKVASDDLWLTGSAEHTLCAYYMGETLKEVDLPIRLVGYNTAYRREVGSAGKDTRGIIRQHQFDKLEMESFATPETALQEHYFMVAIQEYLMEQLEIHFQTVLKCTFDMGGPNIRGVDINTWMPGQAVFCETNSADYLGDFQARGLNTKFIDKNQKKQLVHTNDATVFCQRHIVAILENYQLANGQIAVPKILQPYLKGRTILG